MTIKALIKAVPAALAIIGGQAVSADLRSAPMLTPRPITQNDLKPRYVPSVPTRPDFTRPMPTPLPMPPKPELTIQHGREFGIAPTVIVPLRNGGRVEIKGPQLHPQVPPTLGGSLTGTFPLPEGKKK